MNYEKTYKEVNVAKWSKRDKIEDIVTILFDESIPINKIKKILCFIGIHKWRNYAFDKPSHESVIAAYQECIRCGKKRTFTYGKENNE